MSSSLRGLLSRACPLALLVLSLSGLTGCGDEAPSQSETTEVTAQAEWPQFRGHGGMGVTEGVKLPMRWADDSPNIRWRTPLPGNGNSAPVVAGGRVFLTAIEGERPGEKKAASRDPVLTGEPPTGSEAGTERKRGEGAQPATPRNRLALALDAMTGELLWQTPIFSAPPEKPHHLNTNAAPSPVTDGEHLWVYFGSHLAKLDLDGTLKWSLEIDPSYSSHVRYGIASSPILANGLLVLYQDREWAETPDVGWLAAFDAETGEQRWRHEWSDKCCSYTTPILWPRSARTDLVVAHSASTAGYDLETGAERWRFEHRQFQPVSSPSVSGDLLCLLGGAHRNKSNICLQGFDEGPETRLEELWRETRRAPETASPVLIGERIFAITDGGVFSAYEARTGRVLNVARVKSKGFRSSLIAGDGKIYAVSTWGVTAVLATGGDKPGVLAYNTLSEAGNNATPAVGAGCLLLRTAGSLVCIEPEAEPVSAGPELTAESEPSPATGE